MTLTLLDAVRCDTRTAYDEMHNGLDGWGPKRFGRPLTNEELVAAALDEGRCGEVHWRMPAVIALTQAFGQWWAAAHDRTLPDVVVRRTYAQRAGHHLATFEVAGHVYSWTGENFSEEIAR